jgi:ABC-type multidrug transport system, permease component
MQAFKAYFKIVNKRKSGFLVYFIIFLLISVVITNSLAGMTGQAFSQAKSNIAFYSAENTPLVQGLKDYLSKNAVLVDVPDTQQDIQDALFYQKVSYVLRVPQGFTDSFMQNTGSVTLQKQVYPGQSFEMYTDMLVNRYLNTAQLYLKNLPGITQDQIVQNVAKNLEQQATVNMAKVASQQDSNFVSYYFQYLAYAIMAIVIMGVTSVMMTFNEADLQNRNIISPVRQTSMNMQLFLGNMVFGLFVWLALCIISFILYGKITLNTGTMLLCLNALALTLVSLSIGFLAGKFIQNHGAQGAIVNVISLGLSFISGVFVPQDMLGNQVLAIASFTPNYWYVRAVADLRDMTVFSSQNVTPVVYDMLIQLGFAAAILIIALLLTKQRKLANAYS